MKGFCVLLAHVFALTAIDPAFGQRAVVNVPRTRLKETLSPTPASDMRRAIYGLTADDPALRVDYPAADSRRDPAILVDGLGPRGGPICISIDRAQGGYRAEFSARAPAGVGSVKVAFDSAPEVRKRMQTLRPSTLELGAKVTLPVAGSCTGLGPLLPAQWTKPPADGRYRLLVGAAAMGRPSIKLEGGPLLACEPISSKVRTDLGAGAYAYACPFEAPARSCAEPRRITVMWFQGSRLADDAVVTFLAPCRS